MPLGAAQAQERNSCNILLAPRPAGGRGGEVGDGAVGDPGRAARRRRLTRRQASAPRPSLRAGGSPRGAGPRQRRLPQPHHRPPPRRRRRQAPGANETRPAPRRGGAAEEPGRRAGNRGANAPSQRAGRRRRGAEQSGAELPTQIYNHAIFHEVSTFLWLEEVHIC
ncbi:translation initiation factor IF-2-like [Harpia harpyja]|uniref:translation initiation factor IF-2-like n=1 Tax=Harpia harpyja TaxID=202280 RepID=UPI0022B17D8E|nr:translation initiation factor IF-2-like [Harpia harpyja]